jgi:tetratricopeptide (TPR) repeat protein
MDQALAIVEQFKKMSRMDFATLSAEQIERGKRLRRLIEDVELDAEADGREQVGSLLQIAGTLAFYDNDVVEARLLLDRAAGARAVDHVGALETDEAYRFRFAFTHYFRALIHKNWGDLSDARHEIEQSTTLLASRTSEFLAPVTMGEIISYIRGDEQRARVILDDNVRRMSDLHTARRNEGTDLDPNQKRLRNRALTLLGNTHFVLGEFDAAAGKYAEALTFNGNDYYAMCSLAQCNAAASKQPEAKALFTRCLEAIVRSGDFRRKRERSTLVTIATTAVVAATHSEDQLRRIEYAAELKELLSGNLAVADLIPKFFSQTTKRLVTSDQLLEELRDVV